MSLKQWTAFVLPFTVTILIPAFIVGTISIKSIPALVTGLLIIASGLTIMIITVSLFHRTGQGSLAPWNPPLKLVIAGPYRYVRNPMILGVLIVLAGESVAVLSLEIFIWALIFFIINNVYFILYEEPGLEERFGDEYKKYKECVPRWIPLLKPYCSS